MFHDSALDTEGFTLIVFALFVNSADDVPSEALNAYGKNFFFDEAPQPVVVFSVYEYVYSIS